MAHRLATADRLAALAEAAELCRELTKDLAAARAERDELLYELSERMTLRALADVAGISVSAAHAAVLRVAVAQQQREWR